VSLSAHWRACLSVFVSSFLMLSLCVFVSEYGRAWWGWAWSCLCAPGLLCVHDVFVCLCLGMGAFGELEWSFLAVLGAVLESWLEGLIRCPNFNIFFVGFFSSWTHEF